MNLNSSQSTQLHKLLSNLPPPTISHGKSNLKHSSLAMIFLDTLMDPNLSTQNSNHKQCWHTKSCLHPLDPPRSTGFECSHWLSLTHNHLIHCSCQYLPRSMDYSSKYLCQTISWSHQTSQKSSQKSQQRHYDSNWFSPLCQSTHRWTSHPRRPNRGRRSYREDFGCTRWWVQRTCPCCSSPWHFYIIWWTSWETLILWSLSLSQHQIWGKSSYYC